MTPLILIPLMAFCNRWMRGAGNAPRPVWFSFNAALAYALSRDIALTALWLALIAAYSIPPTQAVFCVVSQNAPGRDDAPPWGFLQKWAYKATGFRVMTRKGYIVFGLWMGFFRGLLTVPAVAWLALYTQSFWPLVGLALVPQGHWLLLSNAICKRVLPNRGAEVKVAEWMIGAVLGLTLGVSL